MRNPYPKGSVEYHSLRGRAYSQAAARRELWRMYHAMRTAQLRAAHVRFAWLTTSEDAKRVRPGNIQRVDRWYLHMIATELRKRGARVA